MWSKKGDLVLTQLKKEKEASLEMERIKRERVQLSNAIEAERDFEKWDVHELKEVGWGDYYIKASLRVGVKNKWNKGASVGITFVFAWTKTYIG